MKTTIIFILTICCSITGCSRKQETPPVQTLLDTFAEAVANQNTETMITLFLAPDETPEGVNRKKHIDEMQKDWAKDPFPDKLSVTFTNVAFDNKSLLKADMVLTSTTEKIEMIAVNFKVRLSNNEWKIVMMDLDYAQ
jgi:hypothetical protein